MHESPYPTHLLRKVGGVRALMPFPFVLSLFGYSKTRPAVSRKSFSSLLMKIKLDLAAPDEEKVSKNHAFCGSR